MRSVLPALVALLAAAAAALASPLHEAATLLDGEWRGPGIVLRIDSERAQANVEPARPFAWQRFEVKDVRDGEVIFTVGGELFEATIGADILVLRSTSFRGERVLLRSVSLRGTTTE